MGEESDGDGDLLEEGSEQRSDPAEEADELPAERPGPETDGPDRGEPAEPRASPSEEPAEDSPEADDEADDEATDEADDERDGSGNLQPAEPPDVSLSPSELRSRGESDRPPEGPDRPPEGPEPPSDIPHQGARPARPEEAERSEGVEPGEAELPEDAERAEGSAPLAEDVATKSVEDVADRTEPLEDEEMPLADHIEEMLKRLAVILVVAGVVSLAVFPFSEAVINFLWNSILPAGESTRPRLYSPLALLLTKLKVASLAGLVIALPVFVYETYLFMRPGLYPHERRYYLAAVPTSLVLAFVGISFAYFLVLPVIFTYFLYYSEDVTTIAFALTKTFNLILLLMGYLALVFQIPLFIMLAIMMGLTTRRWLVQRRLYFWGGFLGIAFLFSPDPTGMAPIMVATTMVVLFEGTLFLLKWTGR